MKKAVRVIFSKHNRELIKELEILPLDELIKLKRACFMWKLDKNLLPQPIASSFQINNSSIAERLNLSKFCIPYPRTEYAKRHSATKLWNTETPNHLKVSTSIKCFKKMIVLYFSLECKSNFIYFPSATFSQGYNMFYGNSEFVYIRQSSDWLNALTL